MVEAIAAEMIRLALCSLLVIAATVTCELSPEAEACVSPLSAKLEAETDEELKTAINAGLAKYMEGDEEEAKAIVKALSEEQSTRYRDFYLVDECAGFREMFGF